MPGPRSRLASVNEGPRSGQGPNRHRLTADPVAATVRWAENRGAARQEQPPETRQQVADTGVRYVRPTRRFPLGSGPRGRGLWTPRVRRLA